MLSISIADGASDDLLEAVSRLLPQLSSSAAPLGRAELEEIVCSPTTALLIARDDQMGPGAAGEGATVPQGVPGAVVGMLTLVTFRIPTGIRAWVEDVVVDDRARGRGAGEALVRAALEEAAARGAKTVDLTSRPSRAAANRLYTRAGFELRETNVYRHDLRRQSL